jgi:hypothetical protein
MMLESGITLRYKFAVNATDYRVKFSILRTCELYKPGRLDVGVSIMLKRI